MRDDNNENPDQNTPEQPNGRQLDAEQRKAEDQVAHQDYDATGLDPQVDKAGTDKPLYGGMMSDYPNYNPYLFGAPDSAPNQQNAGQPNQQGQPYGQQAPYGQQPYGQNQQYGPYGQPNQNPYYGQPYGAPQGQPMPGMGNANGINNGTGQNFGPFQQPPFNPGDPQQNPYYGRWDGFAIIAFVASIFGLWFISVPLAIFSLSRVKHMHMRGKGLAIASLVIIAVLLIGSFVLTMTGQSQQLTNSLIQMLKQSEQ
ncbi:MAG: hypothetical protein U0K19_05160 [Bifidobacteriaceae bacterium]|nr:hypothetical protein [Bifidobacteriaceae bacterium]